ncbi:MAG TPA: polysaccharide deacetylase family protein [Pyrinomonadaceae bacterium]|nr:polysaccharide deacetylase family protein [Pyrinomonadaceae bacterium]
MRNGSPVAHDASRQLSGFVFRSTSAISILFCGVFLLLIGCALMGANHFKRETITASPHIVGHGSVGEVTRGPLGRSEIAITFDAGAEADCFEDLITALESAHVRSTFFVTGNWAQKNRQCTEAITKHGHEIGNHTWNHLNLTQQPDNVVREEITRADVILNEISGQSPRPRWRAPYGERDDRVLRLAASLGYKSIYWTLDSLDGVEPVKTPQFLVDRITSRSDAELDGAIILMHVGERSTAGALPVIIANLQGRGFRLVTISELLQTMR